VFGVARLQVYWGNGCQIIPPHDAGIAASIESHLELWDLPAQLPDKLLSDPTQAIARSYYSKLTENLLMRSAEANAAAAPAVYTPLHGVGGKYVQRAFKVIGMRPAGSFPEMATEAVAAFNTRLVLASHQHTPDDSP
jgi:phosphomannomutase